MTHLNDARTASAYQPGMTAGQLRGYDGVGRIVAHRWLACSLDSAGFVTAYTSTTPDIGFRHAWNAADNKLSQELMHGTDKSEAYQYDSANRLLRFDRGTLNASLTQVVIPTPISGLVQAQTWTLDGPGNWPVNTVTTGGTAASEVRVHNNLNQITLLGATPLAYDSNGNLTDDGTYLFAWDAKNRLRRATRKSDSVVVGIYAYDALGRRIRRIYVAPGSPTPAAVTVHYYLDSQRVIEEREPSGGSEPLARQYTHGSYIDEVLTLDRDLNANGSATDSGERLFYHANTLYSIYALSDSSRNQPERYIYDAYGRSRLWLPGIDAQFGTADDTFASGTASTVGSPRLFTGRELDPECGITYFRLRRLAPILGRFISRDIALHSFQPNGHYVYTHSSPTISLDPSGAIRVITLPGVKKGRCGEVNARFHFELDAEAPCDGYLCQKLQFVERVLDCCDRSAISCPLKTSDENTYTECWFIKKGAIISTWARNAGYTDEIDIGPKEDSRGCYSVIGDLAFVCEDDVDVAMMAY